MCRYVICHIVYLDEHRLHNIDKRQYFLKMYRKVYKHKHIATTSEGSSI